MVLSKSYPLRGMRKKNRPGHEQIQIHHSHAAGIDEADITQLIGLKAKAKERAASKGIHLTFLPFVIKAVIAALQEHPYLNSSFDDEAGEIILKKYYNMGWPWIRRTA